MIKKSAVLLLFLISLHGQSQGLEGVKNRVKKLLDTDKPVVILPAFFVSPETSVGMGVATMYYFRPGKDTLLKPSSFQSFFIYTFKNQVLFKNPYELFLNKNKYWINGELSYYIYPYQYYGQGVNIDATSFDAYSANYIRFELNALKEVQSKLYIGPSLMSDNYLNVKILDGGRLASDQIYGIKGGKLLGIGGTFILDHRDNIYAPRGGYFFETKAIFYENSVIGDYQFSDITLDLRKYFYLNNEWETGLQFYHQSITGNAPFYNLAQMGDNQIMRGYYGGAYRDQNMSAIQGELRHDIFGRVIGSAFAGMGTVTNHPMEIKKMLGSYGVGLRYEINRKERVRIRIDYARGYKQDGIYIDINEAF